MGDPDLDLGKRIKRAPSTTHAPTRRLLDALYEQGWLLTAIPYPGAALLSHPLCSLEVPTPDYVTRDMWPGATYRKLRQLHVSTSDGERITAAFTRESACPWVKVSERKVSLRRATEYVRAPWNPTEGS